MIKLYSVIVPFIKEILLGNKKIKNQERNVSFFLVFACLIMFLMLFVSNLTNGRLIAKNKELETSIISLKEETKTIGKANDNLTQSLNQQNITLNECDTEKEKLYEKIEELENIDCTNNDNSLSSKYRNIENGVCQLSLLNLKADMPELPKISKTITDDNVIDDIMIKYIVDLRDYVRLKNEFIEKQKNNCK